MLRGIIIEDEQIHADELRKILNRLQPELSCSVLKNGREALEYLKTCRSPPDLFFIRRELCSIDGFLLASRIRSMSRYVLTPIVFITDYETDGMDIFPECHCCSYMVTPLSEKVVKSSIGSLLQNLGAQKEEKQERKLKRIIPLQVEGDIKLVDAEAILGLETSGKNCFIYVGKHKYRILRRTLQHMVMEINEPYCVKCHKSFALNLRNVVDIKKSRRNIWVPVFSRETDFQCEISKTHYDAVMERFRQYLSRTE